LKDHVTALSRRLLGIGQGKEANQLDQRDRAGSCPVNGMDPTDQFDRGLSQVRFVNCSAHAGSVIRRNPALSV
jgi:hypothetical protein